jgi:hypothetical protein
MLKLGTAGGERKEKVRMKNFALCRKTNSAYSTRGHDLLFGTKV